MAKLLEYKNLINDKVKDMGKEGFKLKGQIGLKAGLVIGLIDEKTPDNPAQIQAMKAAIREILGITV